MTAQNLEKAAVGAKYKIAKIDDRGHVVKMTPVRTGSVATKCTHSANAGQWVCITHGMTFTNQFCKDTHIHEGTHVLAWWCSQCDNVQVP